MVQQVITLCDVCYDEGKTEAAETHLVAVAGGRWALELCEAHRVALIDPLADVAQRLGEVVKTTGKPGRPRGGATPVPARRARTIDEPCLICGASLVDASGLTRHLKDAHGIDGIAGAYGTTCPLCAEAFATSTGLGKHVSAHDVQGAPEAFRLAWEAGDPHDVVAKRLAHLGLDGLPVKTKP